MTWLKQVDVASAEPKVKALLEGMEAQLGFVPESMRLMAYVPELIEAWYRLVWVILGTPEQPRRTPPSLLWMAGHVSSLSAGCRYCQAHTTFFAVERAGVAPEKASALWDFDNSAHFDDAERVVLRLAAAAGAVPNEVTADHIAAVSEHFDEQQIVEIMAVISMFGFMNRWNDSFGTTLEPAAAETAGTLLGSSGWTAGRHAAPMEGDQC